MTNSFNMKSFILKISTFNEVEEKEFQQLVTEIAALGFTHSGQVSQYIFHNKLGSKYQNISGILEMKKLGESWSFEGGFPPQIYARLCQELKLSSNNSGARPGKFVAFKDANL